MIKKATTVILNRIKPVKFSKSVTFILCIGFFSVLAGCSRAPGVETLSGDEYAIDALKGRWIFVNYWAEWCKPCATEIPELNQFAQTHENEAVVLGVNFDGVTGDTLKQQSEKLKIEFAVAVKDPAQLLGLPRPQSLPATYVIDQQGNYRTVLMGPQTHQSLKAAMQ